MLSWKTVSNPAQPLVPAFALDATSRKLPYVENAPAQSEYAATCTAYAVTASAHAFRSASLSDCSPRNASAGAPATASRAASRNLFSARPSTYKNVCRFSQNPSDSNLKIGGDAAIAGADMLARSIATRARVAIRMESSSADDKGRRRCLSMRDYLQACR